MGSTSPARSMNYSEAFYYFLSRGVDKEDYSGSAIAAAGSISSGSARPRGDDGEGLGKGGTLPQIPMEGVLLWDAHGRGG